MEELSALLIELLQTHDRVSLPGIGAFLATEEAARIDEQTNSIVPPSKKITFSKEETWNDELLEELFAERRKITKSEAQERVKFLMMDIRFELDDKGKVTFPGLGSIRQGQMRDISFGQNKKTNLSPGAFGLQKVPLSGSGGKRILFPENFFSSKKPKAEKSKKPAQSQKASSGGGSFLSHRVALVVLAGLVSIMVAVSTFLLLSRGSNRNAKALVAPDTQTAQPAARSLSDEVAAENDEYLPSATETPAVAPKPKPRAVAAPVAGGGKQYCVIVANVRPREAAIKKVDSYINAGYPNSHIADEKNGGYRISIGCFSNKEQARRELAKIKGIVKDAWLLEM